MKAKKFKFTLNTVYSLGASVVILGAMFKILHLPGAGAMLGLGLTVEAIIFLIFAFEKPNIDPDWSLVYPELAGMDGHSIQKKAVGANGGSITQGLDKMLEDAKVGPELIQSLGVGLRTFGDKVSAISNVADASTSTKEFNEKVKSATVSMHNLGESFTKATSSLAEIGNTAGDSKNYHEQVSQLGKNLSALNAVYELELQESNNHMKVIKSMYGNISETMKNFNDSLNDSKQYKEEVAKLTRNLSSLNSVYGNMLSAMSGGNKSAQ